jgi:CheY-like chemotaxis protein
VSAKKKLWPRQVAVIVSDAQNVHMMIKELIRSFGWTVDESTGSIERAAMIIKQGRASILIADDTPTLPASKIIRHMLQDPITILTPTLSFLLEANKPEAPAMQRLLNLQLVEKPLTPSKFIPAFMNLVRRWEKEPYVHLRRAANQLINGSDLNGIKLLLKLNESPAIQHICAQTLSQMLRQQGKIKEAENLLLTSLKRAPRELGTILCLADLYMKCGMPKMAHRLLLSARSNFGNSLITVPDLMHSALLMNKIDDAIESLYVLQRAGFCEEETNTYLARLLFSEGRIAEAETVLYNNKHSFKRIQVGWEQAETQALNVAS